METSLHRELKALYAGTEARCEVKIGRYRADALVDCRVVEIQHGPLAAIRDKVRALLRRREVMVVKPIVRRKLLVKRTERGGPVVERRLSPKRGRLLDLFDELVHFTRVFPHRRLTLEVPLIDVEEWRYPGHGRRRRWRRSDHEVEDQKLLEIHERHTFRTAEDLVRLIPRPLPEPFHTGQLAEIMDVPRWLAQRIAYCLYRTRATRLVGRRGNARLYRAA